MLPIKKKPAPPGLHNYLNKHPANADYNHFTNYKEYENTSGEDAFFELRAQLLREQKHVCAYCGQKLLEVENENGLYQMKTEHFIPQNGKASNDLKYPNLLACCLGGEREAGAKYCDASKKGTELAYLQNPAINRMRDRSIKYKVRPKSQEVIVFSTDDGKDNELNKVLNLNHDRLRRRRFSVWKAKIEHIIERKRRLKELIDEYSGTPRGYNKEFKDFVLWYVDDLLRRGK